MLHMWEEIHEQPEVLRICLENNINVIKDIIKCIHENDIRLVYIAARGTSDHAAVYAKYVIELLTGVPVGLAAPSIFTVYQGSLKLNNSLVIGISQSGKAADVLEVIKKAKEAGAITVSITNFVDSPLAQESRYHLYCSAGLEKSVAATKTFTSQIFLIAWLATEWAGSEEIKAELRLVPQKLSQTFEIAQAVEDKVKRYRFMDECFVLARGVNYAIALEAALKIQETSYARAKAYATSDFYHGPFAMVERGIPAIVFAPEGPSLKYVAEMINKLKENQVELIIVSNNKEILGLGTTAFSVPPASSDAISPFSNVVVAQMFACRLSLEKGLNPDSPKGLSKITVTR